jgi:hypothetical protein
MTKGPNSCSVWSCLSINSRGYCSGHSRFSCNLEKTNTIIEGFPNQEQCHNLALYFNTRLPHAVIFGRCSTAHRRCCVTVSGISKGPHINRPLSPSDASCPDPIVDLPLREGSEMTPLLLLNSLYNYFISLYSHKFYSR